MEQVGLEAQEEKLMDYEYAHKQMLGSENDVLMIRLLAALVCVIAVTGVLFFAQAKIYEIVYEEKPIEAFMDTQESVIEELYGSPTAYADGKALQNKSQFVDLAKTAVLGSIQYDEEAYQAYYNGFIEEFYSQVDYEEINKILEEREKAFEKRVKKSSGGISIFPMIWMCVITVSLVNVFYVLLYYQRYSAISKKEYTLWEGTIVSKEENRKHVSLVKTSAIVDCGEESLRVTMTLLQALKMQEGDEVYVAEINKDLFLKSAKFTICKR